MRVRSSGGPRLSRARRGEAGAAADRRASHRTRRGGLPRRPADRDVRPAAGALAPLLRGRARRRVRLAADGDVQSLRRWSDSRFPRSPRPDPPRRDARRALRPVAEAAPLHARLAARRDRRVGRLPPLGARLPPIRDSVANTLAALQERFAGVRIIQAFRRERTRSPATRRRAASRSRRTSVRRTSTSGSSR